MALTDIKNKTVLVTGASSGIGQACADLFASLGARLILLARREERLLTLSHALTAAYAVECHTVTLDIQERDTVKHAIASLPSEWQDIDILVNNAGLAAGLSGFADADIDDWEAMLDTNVKGLLYITRAILPGMRERDAGHIINIGSIAGHEIYPNGNVYCGTKHAVRAITRGIKMDMLDSRIRVTSVDPGMVDTEFSTVRFKGDTSRASSVYDGMTPLTASDVADTVVYCASRPPHVNIAEVLMLPTDQASATCVKRRNS